MPFHEEGRKLWGRRKRSGGRVFFAAEEGLRVVHGVAVRWGNVSEGELSSCRVCSDGGAVRGRVVCDRL